VFFNFSSYVQPAARQAMQNCQISSADYQPYHLNKKHRFDWEYLTVSTNLSCLLSVHTERQTGPYSHILSNFYFLNITLKCGSIQWVNHILVLFFVNSPYIGKAKGLTNTAISSVILFSCVYIKIWEFHILMCLEGVW
jgi:hypothetical protein